MTNDPVQLSEDVIKALNKQFTPKALAQKSFFSDYSFAGVRNAVPMDDNLPENKAGIGNPVADLKTETEGATSVFTVNSFTFTFKNGLLVDVTNVSPSSSVSPSVSPS